MNAVVLLEFQINLYNVVAKQISHYTMDTIANNRFLLYNDICAPNFC